MSKWDEWLRMQRTQVDAGVLAARIVLESPQGDPFATWAVSSPALESSVEVIVRELSESLPRGKHACRLVSYDENRQQLSAMPIVLVGVSDPAAQAAEGRIGEQRANALMLSNAEKVVQLYRETLDGVSEHVAAMREGLAERDRYIERLESITNERQKELIKTQAREDRITAIANQFAPLVEVGLGVLSQFTAEWLEKRSTSRGTGDKVESLDGRPGPTASEQPAVTRAAGSDSQPELAQGDGEGCLAGSLESSPCRNAGGETSEPAERRSVGPQHSERSHQKRERSYTSDRKGKKPR